MTAAADNATPATETHSAAGIERAVTGSDFVAPSENFERAFSSASGGCVRDCECGITFFDVHNTWDWEDGELEALCKKRDANPDKYIAQPHSVSTIYLEGREYVMGCPKCDRPGTVEAWLIRNARQIAEYLNLRAKDLEREAKATKVNCQNSSSDQ